MALKLDLNLWMDRVFNLTPSPDLYANNANIVIATSATLGGIPQSLAASTSQIVVQSNASLENKKDLDEIKVKYTKLIDKNFKVDTFEYIDEIIDKILV